MHISKAVNNRRANRPGTAYLAQMLEDQAEVLVELGRFDAAKQALVEAEAIREKVHVTANEDYLRGRLRLALEERNLPEATALLEKYAADHTERRPFRESDPEFLWARGACFAEERPGGSDCIGEEPAEAPGRRPHGDVFRLWRVRGLIWEARADLLQRKPESALPLLKEAVGTQKTLLDEHSPELAASEALLGSAYLAIK